MGNGRLREAVAQSGMSRQEIAERIGVDPKTLQRWISTGRLPYAKHRVRLARLLDQPEDELWGDDSGLAGDWWAAWQSSKGGKELVAVQPARLAQRGDTIQWEALERGRPVAEGGYLWAGEMRLWDNEILMGHYVATDAAVRSKGTVYFRLHPQGRLMVGRWTGLSYDGYLFSGWGVLARDEDEARTMIGDLMDHGEQQWTTLST